MEVLGPSGHAAAGLPRRRCCAGGSNGCTGPSLILTFGGGTNEVQRDIIAMTALGLPPAKR